MFTPCSESIVTSCCTRLEIETGGNPIIRDLRHQARQRAALRVGVDCLLALQISRGLLDVAPYAKQIAAPYFCDLVFRITPPREFERHIESFGGAVPAIDAAASVEVR